MDQILQSPATFLLIAANVIASLAAFSYPRFMEKNTLHVGPIMRNREYHRMLTSGFLHVNGMHLFVNMLTLYFFGPLMESALGSVGFVIVYFGSLIAGSAWAVMERRKEYNYRAIGASGAVSGILVGACLFIPFELLYLFFAIPIPAILFAVGYIALSAALSGRQNSLIGHEAHLGGALGGLLLTMLVEPRALSIFSSQVAGLFGG